jgi:hypothetical protein
MKSSDILSIIISITVLGSVEAFMLINSATEAHPVNQDSHVTLNRIASYDPDYEPLTLASTQHGNLQVGLGRADTSSDRFTTTSDLQDNIPFSYELTASNSDSLSMFDTVSTLIKHSTANTPTSTGTTFDFGAAGDFGSESNATDTAQSMVNHHVNLFVGEGDYCYCDSDGGWWTSTMKPLSSSGIIAKGSEGNHELTDSHGGNDLRQMWGQDSWQTSFDYKNTHFVLLPEDSAKPDPIWLSKDLDSARANAHIKWIVVVFHEPIYTSKSKHLPDEKGIKKTILPIIDKHHVDLVLQGHNHNYQRTFPMSSNQVTDRSADSNYKDPKGTMYMVIGTGGQENDELGNQSSYVQKQVPNDQGFVDFHVTDNQIKGTYYSNNGDAVRDTFSISK